MPIVIGLLVFYEWEVTINSLWALLGFLTLLFNALWVQLFFGLICAKFRDITHLVQSMMRVMFFLTPILYMPEQLGSKAHLLNYNPFTHYIAIIRDPIFLNEFPILSWQVVGGLTLLGWILALLTFRKMGPTVAFRV